MKKNLKKESIDFVAHYYVPGAFNASKAWKALGIFVPWYARTSVRRAMWSAAAVAVIFAAGIYYFVSPSNDNFTNLYADNSIVSATLPDGSAITLYPGSSLKYDASAFASIRNVTLSGKAFFEVTRNEKAAFKVFAGETEVEVLGTRFMVNQAGGDSVCVSVESGRVKVANASGEDCVITAGMSAVSLPAELSVSSAELEVDVQDVSLAHLAMLVKDKYGLDLINLPDDGENISLSYKGDAQGLVEILNDMFDSNIALK